MKEFLEINGKNLEEIYINGERRDSALKFSIAKFCPNLKKLSINNGELDLLKTIFISCQQLESIKFCCNGELEKMFNIVAKYSPENFHELKYVMIYNQY